MEYLRILAADFDELRNYDEQTQLWTVFVASNNLKENGLLCYYRSKAYVSIMFMIEDGNTSATLIDNIISNTLNRVTYCNVLPCPTVSDHDAPYACINVRAHRFQPRFKLLRDEKQFDEKAFIDDIASLPFNIVYSIDDPYQQLYIFNLLIKDSTYPSPSFCWSVSR